MDAKLTLRLDGDIIARAKQYAIQHNLSLSGLVENYLHSLTNKQKDDFEISPFVRSISNGKAIDADAKRLKKDIDYLDEKYQ